MEICEAKLIEINRHLNAAHESNSAFPHPKTKRDGQFIDKLLVKQISIANLHI